MRAPLLVGRLARWSTPAGSRIGFVLFGIALLTSSGCRKHEHAQNEHDHHDGRGAHGAIVEVPTLDVTVYDSGLELFMEYPAFVVGAGSALVAHFSDARDAEGFKGIASGRVTATLRFADGVEEHFVAAAPQRLGVFRPVVTPSRAGKATLTLQLDGAQTGTVHVGDVVVHADVAAAVASVEAEVAGAEKTFPYFKEAMWKTSYATAVADKRVLRGGIVASGEIVPVAGRAAALSATTAARVVVGDDVPHLGQRVKRGQTLFTLMPVSSSQGDPASVQLELAEARADLGLKQRALIRAQELLAIGAIASKQIDGATVGVEIATARVDAATQRLAQLAGSSTGATAMRAPIDGVISFADLLPGAVAAAGQQLVVIVDARQVWLRVDVAEVDVAVAAASTAASFTVRGFEHPFRVEPPAASRVAVGATIDPRTRTVPVIFQLPNPDEGLKPGMFADVVLFTGDTVEGLAVPDAAVLDDDGRAVVYVMAGGESFFLRRVRTGVRADGYTQILDGVAAGERVVSRGAFEIKLANAGGIPAHGHQH